MKREIRIIHAEDSDLLREAIKLIIQSSSENLKVVAEAISYNELCFTLQNVKADLLLLDGNIIGGSTSGNLPIMRDLYLGIKILLLWIGANEETLSKWVHLLDGQINVIAKPEELIIAIETIMKGESFFSLPVLTKNTQ